MAERSDKRQQQECSLLVKFVDYVTLPLAGKGVITDMFFLCLLTVPQAPVCLERRNSNSLGDEFQLSMNKQYMILVQILWLHEGLHQGPRQRCLARLLSCVTSVSFSMEMKIC